jgi:hypothetical protein
VRIASTGSVGAMLNRGRSSKSAGMTSSRNRALSTAGSAFVSV